MVTVGLPAVPVKATALTAGFVVLKARSAPTALPAAVVATSR
jgi:hypothetical protein